AGRARAQPPGLVRHYPRPTCPGLEVGHRRGEPPPPNRDDGGGGGSLSLAGKGGGGGGVEGNGWQKTPQQSFPCQLRLAQHARAQDGDSRAGNPQDCSNSLGLSVEGWKFQHPADKRCHFVALDGEINETILPMGELVLEEVAVT